MMAEGNSAMGTRHSIEARGVSFGYGRRANGEEPLLSIDSLLIPEKKTTAILGPNGSGKSTLLKLLCGIHAAWSGDIILFGKPLRTLPGTERARKIAFVPQNAPTPDIATGSLVLHGRFPHKGLSPFRNYSKDDKEKARHAMEQMNILPLAERNVRTLSAGQRQRAFIALALAQETPALVLDEPFAFLDIREQLELSRTLASMGKTVVVVLHDIPLALERSDRVALLERGRLRAFGTPREVLDSGSVQDVFGVRVGRRNTLSFSL